ncbi:MAG: thioredoxin family protein [Dehalococcoidia bacterium]
MIPLREQDYVRERFGKELEGKVKLDYFTQRASKLYVPGREECVHCEDVHKMLEEIASLSDKVSLTVHEFADTPEEAAKLGIDKVPGIVLRGPMNRPLRFFGIPGGNEFPNFIETMIEASKQKVTVGPGATKQLKKLRDKTSIVVYVTPTCPHCPGVVRAAYRLALASAHVRAAAVEINEFPRLAQQLGVRAVPFTVINERSAIPGAIDEAALAELAVQAADHGMTASETQGGATSELTSGGGAPPSGGLVLPR